MLDFNTLPRDADGAIQGRYRVTVHGGLRDDLRGKPVEGGEIVRLHAAVGSSGMTIEPWADRKVATPRRKVRR